MKRSYLALSEEQSEKQLTDFQKKKKEDNEPG
jgi:hypothetical protein